MGFDVFSFFFKWWDKSWTQLYYHPLYFDQFFHDRKMLVRHKLSRWNMTFFFFSFFFLFSEQWNKSWIGLYHLARILLLSKNASQTWTINSLKEIRKREKRIHGVCTSTFFFCFFSFGCVCEGAHFYGGSLIDFYSGFTYWEFKALKIKMPFPCILIWIPM